MSQCPVCSSSVFARTCSIGDQIGGATSYSDVLQNYGCQFSFNTRAHTETQSHNQIQRTFFMVKTYNRILKTLSSWYMFPAKYKKHTSKINEIHALSIAWKLLPQLSLWGNRFHRPSVAILSCSPELLRILFGLWWCDNIDMSPVSSPAISCCTSRFFITIMIVKHSSFSQNFTKNSSFLFCWKLKKRPVWIWTISTCVCATQLTDRLALVDTVWATDAHCTYLCSLSPKNGSVSQGTKLGSRGHR